MKKLKNLDTSDPKFISKLDKLRKNIKQKTGGDANKKTESVKIYVIFFVIHCTYIHLILIINSKYPL